MSKTISVKKLTPQIARKLAKNPKDFSYIVAGRVISSEMGRKSLYAEYWEFVGDFTQVMQNETTGEEIRNTSTRLIVPKILEDKINIALSQSVQGGRGASVEFAVKLMCKPHTTREDAREWTMEELGEVKMSGAAGIADSILARAMGVKEEPAKGKGK